MIADPMPAPHHNTPPHRAAHTALIAAALILCVTASTQAQHAAPSNTDTNLKAVPETIEYKIHVEPIFRRHCYDCHGPKRQQADLRLDTREGALAGGNSGLPLLEGPAKDNELIARVTSDDDEFRMPRYEEPLSAFEIEILKRWIDQGADWPDEKAEGRWDAWLERLNAAEHWHKTYLARYQWTLLVALLVWLIVERSKQSVRRAAKAANDEGTNGKDVPNVGPLTRRLARFPRSLIFCVMLIVGVVQMQLFEAAMRQRIAELSQRPTSLTGLDDDFIFGSPPRPLPPRHGPRLAGTYYRGNCERHENLYNNGNYLTCTFHVALVDAAGQPVNVGDDLPTDGMQIRLEIDRAPHVTDRLFSDKIMQRVRFTDAYPRPDDDDANVTSNPLSVVEKNQRWRATFPVKPMQSKGNSRAKGVVYLYNDSRPHYAVEYDLQATDGKLLEASSVWLGAVFRSSPIGPPVPPNQLPFTEWFNENPIPPIVGGNTTDDPKLLGEDEHLKRKPGESKSP